MHEYLRIVQHMHEYLWFTCMNIIVSADVCVYLFVCSYQLGLSTRPDPQGVGVYLYIYIYASVPIYTYDQSLSNHVNRQPVMPGCPV